MPKETHIQQHSPFLSNFFFPASPWFEVLGNHQFILSLWTCLLQTFYIDGIIQYAVAWDWLIWHKCLQESLSWGLHPFQISLYEHTILFIYYQLMNIWVISIFPFYRQIYKHSYTSVCVDTYFHFSWAHTQ